MPTIVLSYRRDDSKWITGRIFDRLEGHYGRGNVFMDIDTIPVGLDFREHLQQALERCEILLAVVGPRWLGTDEHGRHAISDEADWVRIEIETALAKKIPVVPVLIDRLRMPKVSELPESLRDFAFRQAAEVDSGVDFRSHMERLIRSMDQYLQGRTAGPSISRPAGVPDQQPGLADEVPAGPDATASEETAPTRAPKAPWLPLKKALGVARSAANSWFAVATCLLLSELVAFLSEAIADTAYRLIFVLIAALPLGAAGLMAIALRVSAWISLQSNKTAVRSATLVVGILLIASVPTFFHAVHAPDRYALAAAWPLILFGGFGLTLVAVAVVSHPVDAPRRNAYLMICVGSGALLLAFAWLDSDVGTSKLWMSDWRMRSVVIFTCIFVGTTVLVSTALFWWAAKRDRAAT